MRHLIFGLLLCTATQAAVGREPDVAKVVSDAQALAEAKHNRRLAGELWEANAKACRARDMRGLASVMSRVNAELKAQPTDHQMYWARFAYSGCKELLSDVSFLNGSCLNGVPSEHTMNYAVKSLQISSAQCSSELAATADGNVSEDTVSDDEISRVMRKAAGVAE